VTPESNAMIHSPSVKRETVVSCETLVLVKSEVFTAVTMKNAVFWDVTLCSSCVNRRFGGTYCLHLQGRKISEQGTSVSKWLQTEPPVENTQLYRKREGRRVGPDHTIFSFADFSTLKIEAIYSSETSVHTRSTQRHIPEDGILHW
jgi:hypothetical protein